MANVLGELFQNIANAIRSKTGGTDTITPASFPEKISAIGTSGFVEGVHYVTFMSHDGTTELYKRPVADGDDCADPVSRGYIPAPTKESTAQYDYSFVGWATSANGAWDENALKAVTEDKTVYAAYAAAVRYYTITYYDDDGTTVLKTETLAYGTTPSYIPTKDGYGFDSWIPALSTVTGNASYTAVWSDYVDGGTLASGVQWGLTSDGALVLYGEGAIEDFALTNDTPWYSEHSYDITAIVIDEGITRVGARAFGSLTKLKSITIASSVTSIGQSAFSGSAASLNSVALPEGLVTIENYAFAYKSFLRTVNIPASVTSIGQSAFSGTGLWTARFDDPTTWYVGSTAGAATTQVDVSDSSTAATLLKDTHKNMYWTKK